MPSNYSFTFMGNLAYVYNIVRKLASVRKPIKHGLRREELIPNKFVIYNEENQHLGINTPLKYGINAPPIRGKSNVMGKKLNMLC